MDACAGELLRYRRAVGAENILVFTDIKKKHRLELSSIPFRSITRRAKLTGEIWGEEGGGHNDVGAQPGGGGGANIFTGGQVLPSPS